MTRKTSDKTPITKSDLVAMMNAAVAAKEAKSKVLREKREAKRLAAQEAFVEHCFAEMTKTAKQGDESVDIQLNDDIDAAWIERRLGEFEPEFYRSSEPKAPPS